MPLPNKPLPNNRSKNKLSLYDFINMFAIFLVVTYPVTTEYPHIGNGHSKCSDWYFNTFKEYTFVSKESASIML